MKQDRMELPKICVDRWGLCLTTLPRRSAVAGIVRARYHFPEHSPVLCPAMPARSWPRWPRHLAAPGRLQCGGKYLISPLIFVGAIAGLIMLPGDPSWAQGTTTHRRGFYAFLAFILPWLTGFSFGTQILNLRLFIDTYLKPQGNK